MDQNFGPRTRRQPSVSSTQDFDFYVAEMTFQSDNLRELFLYPRAKKPWSTDFYQQSIGVIDFLFCSPDSQFHQFQLSKVINAHAPTHLTQ